MSMLICFQDVPPWEAQTRAHHLRGTFLQCLAQVSQSQRGLAQRSRHRGDTRRIKSRRAGHNQEAVQSLQPVGHLEPEVCKSLPLASNVVRMLNSIRHRLTSNISFEVKSIAKDRSSKAATATSTINPLSSPSHSTAPQRSWTSVVFLPRCLTSSSTRTMSK